MSPVRECPTCGRPIRSAKGCAGCGPSAREPAPAKNGLAAPATETVWQMPALETAIERRFRQFALPVALLVAWALVHAGFLRMLLRTVLSMWIHELGHAVAAWLCGRWAFPGPWLTPVGSQRSLVVVLIVAGAVAAGVVRLWRSHKPWAVVLALLWPAQLGCAFLLSSHRTDSFILWAGDGGCMLFGTLLMLSFYARPSSSLRKGWLRWGFLVIGAAAFADAFATWWAARTDRDAIPFGENEGRGLSDPTRLVYEQGFSIPGMVNGYVALGVACLVVLAVAYALGLRKSAIAPTES